MSAGEDRLCWAGLAIVCQLSSFFESRRAMSRSQKRVDPRYAVVFGACLTQFMVIGLLFCLFGLFFKTFEDRVRLVSDDAVGVRHRSLS